MLRRHPDPAAALAIDVAGPQTRDNQLTTGQRWAYLTGAIQWYGDLLALLFYLFLLVGSANIAFGGGVLYRKLTGFLVAAIPLLVVLGLLRAVALLRRGTGASWSEAFGAFLIWQSTSLTVARASVQALFAKQAVFLRTPKTREESALADALKANWAESLLGLLGMTAIGAALSNPSGYGGPLLAVLLIWPTVSFLAAPFNSLSAQRAALPPALRERRRTEYLRNGGPRLTHAFGGLAVAVAAVAVAVTLFVPGRATVVPPALLGPARGQPEHYAPSSDPASAPATGSTASATSTPSTTTGSTTTTTTTTTASTTTATTTTPTTTTPTTTTPSMTTPPTTTSPAQAPTTTSP